MNYKRVLTIQDISCVGQCSLTVALPILSACGLETCILPSAVLSTHTGGFKGFTFRDLTDDMLKIADHWEAEHISFDCVYTGYLGSTKQIDYVKHVYNHLAKEKSLLIVDPAMADGGKLYTGFNEKFVDAMKKLVSVSDIVLPNITEAGFLTGLPYKETYGPDYIVSLCRGLMNLGAKTVIMTGVSYHEGKTGVVVFSKDKMAYYEHEKVSKGCHGTGDVYASAFVGALMQGKSTVVAASIAADYTLACIKGTVDDPDHWYGVKFEKSLPELIAKLQ